MALWKLMKGKDSYSGRAWEMMLELRPLKAEQEGMVSQAERTACARTSRQEGASRKGKASVLE